jgi:cyclic AMP-dependent transcription factor ATF-4
MLLWFCRYRQKKKQETEKILDEEKGLKTHNEDLKGKLSDLQREIKYLKSLMREVFKAKGLIK